MFSADDHRFMSEALRLARRGLYRTDPNPRVGCLVVRDGAVVGRGWHRRAGDGHAEWFALKDAGEQARGASVYLTLEPCCHHGRTPPCVDALIAAGVARVVAAMEDPNPLVGGRGIAKLKAAGIATELGLCTSEAEVLNAGFVARFARGRPYVTSKLAVSLDGRTAMASGESQWISGPRARRDVQFLRARSSAVLTGVDTVLADDPALNVRLDPQGEAWRQPLRVILDSELRTPPTAQLLGLPGEVMIFCTEQAAAGPNRATLEVSGARVVGVAEAPGGVDLVAVLERLAASEVNEVLVEAGSTLNGSLMAQALVDRLVIYVAPHIMGDGARGLFHLPALVRMKERIGLRIVDHRAIGDDWRITAVLDSN